MAIENETILNKMLKEINDAKKNHNNQGKLIKHISNVKLLCDLFLEEDSEKVITTEERRDEFTEVELKAMIGKQDTIQKVQQQQLKQLETIDHEKANGDSIFDF
ncbi:YwdI family protein [Oceanobacillus sp. Castelsardo]|uniref:YwdI family protein n=1 Tax=Oceanobacillus sp. Castelsardo TaxID=1851204 RepID=UPI000839A592|nr:YwdI family protein [Oceanobacillus sp. Castelsardo]